ncbi:hypothetical protein CMT48_03545 [Elizabethkingia anophelis]|nr:AAA family ATPase [Elizabethkingia anophelis]EJG2146544.1 AAA family ATPase [Elizabethkingia anophelis]MDV3980129.1 hypothetical protein [Elizabethkingia anophelis]
MKLKQLTLEKFKNLENIDVDFSSHNGLTFLIGNNASGKSNLLELFSEIFFHQYHQTKSEITYNLSYQTFSGKEISLTNMATTSTVDLPKRIVAVYSGEEDRLWKDYYEKPYLDYTREVNKANSLDFPKMFYLNKYYWEIMLLVLLLSDSEDNSAFVKEKLGIETVESIEFKFDKDKYEGYKDNPALAIVKKIDGKDTYTLDELKSLLNEKIDPITQAVLEDEVSLDILFKALYLAYTPKDHKIIEGIKVTFNDGLSVRSLSEGQKKMLLIKGSLEFASSEDTLVLLDEPDAHIHLENKKMILDTLEPYSHNRHLIVSSHSPTLTKLVPNKSVICLENGKLKNLVSTLEAAKYLASSKDIYKLLFSESNILIVEGKTDDKYIAKALELFEDEYQVLEYQILRVGGTDDENIKNLIEAIELKETQKIIILVDRDEAGYKVYKKLFPVEQGKNFPAKKDILIKKFADQIFYLMIPHRNDPNNDGDFMIEDYFKKEKLKELADKYLKEEYLDKDAMSFGAFPNIKEGIKQKLLPNFCQSDECLKEDMEDFKILFDKLQEIEGL